MDHPLTRAAGLALLLSLLCATALGQDVPAERMRAAQPLTPTSPAQSVPLDGHPSLQAYEVGDLTNSVEMAFFTPDAISTADIELAEERLAQLEDLETLRKQAAGALTALEEVVRQNMEPTLRDGVDELRPLGDNLLVLRGSDEQHAWLRGFLETQRTTDSLVTMTAKVWSAPHGLGQRLMSVPEGETQQLLETRADVQDILSRATDLGLETITSPKLMTYPRQRGTVSILNQIAYVSEWKLVRVAPDDALLADPVIDVIQEGLTLDARAVPLAPGFWSIDTEVKFANVERPIATHKVPLGDDGQQVEIALPVVRTVGMSSKFSIGSGGGALFLTHDRVDDRDIVVLLQVEEFDPSALK